MSLNTFSTFASFSGRHFKKPATFYFQECCFFVKKRNIIVLWAFQHVYNSFQLFIWIQKTNIKINDTFWESKNSLADTKSYSYKFHAESLRRLLKHRKMQMPDVQIDIGSVFIVYRLTLISTFIYVESTKYQNVGEICIHDK